MRLDGALIEPTLLPDRTVGSIPHSKSALTTPCRAGQLHAQNTLSAKLKPVAIVV